MNRRLAVLRPEPGNAATVARAEAAGFATISLPLFAVRPLDWVLPDDGYDALLLTSANAVRCGGAKLAALTHLPVLAVGPHTAEAARRAGFDVMATGDADAARIAASAVALGFRQVLHLTGRDRTPGAGGTAAAIVPVYENMALMMEAGALASLEGAVALLHSARAARRLGEVIDAAGIARRTIALAAFSPAVAAAAGSGWSAVATAATPDDDAVFGAARALCGEPLTGRAAALISNGMDETPPVPDPVPPHGVAPEFAASPPPPGPIASRSVPPFVFPPSMSPPSAFASRGMGWRMGVALALIAFLIGIGAATLVILRFGKVDGKPVATVTVPVGNGQPPVVTVPGKTGAAPAVDLAALSAREVELAAKIADLEARMSGVGREAEQASGYATRGEGLMVAFAARRALDRGLNLGFLENQLRGRFGASQPAAVATILQAAREPVTLEDLRAGLDGMTPELLTGAASDGWWQSLRREFGNLVVLRRANTPSPLPVDRIARARRLLEAGQAEAALAEVSRMPGAAQAERWTGAARRYIATRRALDTIETAAILAPAIDASSATTAR